MTATITAGSFDGREGLRELLIEARDTARADRNFFEARKLTKILNREHLFERVYSDAVKRAEFDSSSDPLAMKANGDFAKWFLQWLQNGGFDAIIKRIMQVISLFSKKGPARILMAGDWGDSPFSEAGSGSTISARDPNTEPDGS